MMDGPVRNRGELTTRVGLPPPQPETVVYYLVNIEKVISEFEARLFQAEEQMFGPSAESPPKTDIATACLRGLAELTSRRAGFLLERLNAILTQVGI